MALISGTVKLAGKAQEPTGSRFGKGTAMLDWLRKRNDTPQWGAQDAHFPLVSAGQGGLLAGCHVASNLGWRPVEALTPGDKVLTFDHGMQPVAGMTRETVVLSESGLDPARCPLLVPEGALNNRVEMWLLPDQGVLLESDLVQDAQGDPFAVAPACALLGYRGIRRMHPGARMELVTLQFERDEVIYLEAGMLGFAPASRDLLAADSGEELYKILPPEDARALVLDMIAEDESHWTGRFYPSRPAEGQTAAMM